MRYGILGTTQAVHDDGTPVPLRGARLRVLLAALALHPGRVRTVEALIDEVWPEQPPADAPAALQALVGRLRRAVGHDAVRSGDGGYRLAAEPDDVDLHRFERLAADGGRALADGDAAKAAEALDSALALWRGPALADLTDSTTARAVAHRYETLRTDARRLRLTAEVALGRAGQALPELAELTAGHPLDEPLQALRIRALRDAGRAADALVAYEEVRGALADRLGTDPGPELQALYGELLQPQPHLQPPPPAAPVADRAAGAIARAGNRRPRLTSFVGREADLGRLRADLGASRLVTITGPGGTGKTRLCQEAGDLVAGRWPDGVWFAELAPVKDPGTVPEAVLSALGLRETQLHAGSAAEQALAAESRPQDATGRLAEHCAGRSLLLVLDNCEHLLDAAAALAERLLTDCPGVTVLATSREPLAVPGELVRPLGPLPDPPALRLLADRGAAARPGFTPDEDPEASAELCRRLDGLPLAIELAAARLRGLTPRQLADRLDDRFRILTQGSRTALPRQQTLRAVVDWSWDLLEPAERVLLRRLAVFAGGWTLEAAEQVCADGDDATGTLDDTGTLDTLDPFDTLDAADTPALLASLVDKSLVVADAGDGGPRYRMLETISEYAAERLDESGERQWAERRHIEYFREYVRTADPELRGPRQLLWLGRLEREHDNIRAALRRAVAARDEQEALQLALGCTWFWEMRNYRAEAHHWSRVVTALGPGPFTGAVSYEPLDHGPLDAPPPMAPAQLEEARRWIRMSLALSLADRQELWNDPESAAFGRAFADAYPPELPQSSVRPGVFRMMATFVSGEFDDIPEIVEATVGSCRRHGREWELAFALQLRAKMLNDLSDQLEASLEDVRESQEIFRRLGDEWGLAEAIAGECEAAANAGRWERSAQCAREAIALAGKLGARQQIPLLTIRLSEAVSNGGDPVEGERLLRAAIEDAEKLRAGAIEAVFYGKLVLSTVLGERGDVDEALALVDDLRRTTGAATAMPSFVISMLKAIEAWLIGQGGDPDEGLREHREAVALLEGHPLNSVVAPRIGFALILPGVALLAMAAERDASDEGRALADLGARLLAAHDRLRSTAVTTAERRTLADAADRMRARLGADAYAAAMAAGEQLTLTDALALMR